MKELGKKAGYNNWQNQLDGVYFHTNLYEFNL